MKKLLSTLLLLGFVLILTGLSYPANARVTIGTRSEEIKMIQEILKTDPNIYPEGFVTGYFGRLTERAIKRLQKRCGLPETGLIDEATKKCLYPIEYEIQVVYPNGGEILNRNQIQTIRWKVINLRERPEMKPYPLPVPFWKKASIDLFRKIGEKSIFVRHLAIVDLFDQAYSWKISSDVPNGKDYLIRISLGPGVGPIWYREKLGQPLPSPEKIWPILPLPYHIYWDESDGTFEVSGEIKPPALNLEEVIKVLEKIVEELQKAIALLKKMAG